MLVIGSSIGGWIASEMAVREHQRISGTVLLNAVGIKVDGIELADFFSLTPQELISYSFHDPAAAPDPTQLPQAARDIQAENAATLRCTPASRTCTIRSCGGGSRSSRNRSWRSGARATRSRRSLRARVRGLIPERSVPTDPASRASPAPRAARTGPAGDSPLRPCNEPVRHRVVRQSASTARAGRRPSSAASRIGSR